MAFYEGGVFIVPRLLWHGTSVFKVLSEGPCILSPCTTRRENWEPIYSIDNVCILYIIPGFFIHVTNLKHCKTLLNNKVIGFISNWNDKKKINCQWLFYFPNAIYGLLDLIWLMLGYSICMLLSIKIEGLLSNDICLDTGPRCFWFYPRNSCSKVE